MLKDSNIIESLDARVFIILLSVLNFSIGLKCLEILQNFGIPYKLLIFN